MWKNAITTRLIFLTFGLISVQAEAARNRIVAFGVNGHSLSPGTYYRVSLEQQVTLLKALGLTIYRVNVNPTVPDKFARLSELITIAQHQGIQIVPVVVISAKNYSDENAAYRDAQASMYQLARQFDNRISVWELGNEYDLYCVKNDTDGASPADYDPARYAVVRGLIKGMLDGLHKGSPSSQTIVQTSQHTSQHTSTALDSGFLQKLVEGGITFDITGYHYYSKDGHVPTTADGRNALEILHDEFRRPIWITEFDKSSSSRTVGPSANPKEQGIALAAALNEIAADAEKYDIFGADIYELLDEPELLHNPDVKPCEAQFGILDSQGGFTAASMAVQQFMRSY